MDHTIIWPFNVGVIKIGTRRLMSSKDPQGRAKQVCFGKTSWIASLQPLNSIWFRTLLMCSTVAPWPACSLHCLSISYCPSRMCLFSIWVLSIVFSFSPRRRTNSLHRDTGTWSTIVYKTSWPRKKNQQQATMRMWFFFCPQYLVYELLCVRATNSSTRSPCIALSECIVLIKKNISSKTVKMHFCIFPNCS